MTTTQLLPYERTNAYFAKVVPAINMAKATGIEVEIHYLAIEPTTKIIEAIEMWSAAGQVELASALTLFFCSLPLEHDSMVASLSPADPLYFT